MKFLLSVLNSIVLIFALYCIYNTNTHLELLYTYLNKNSGSLEGYKTFQSEVNNSVLKTMSFHETEIERLKVRLEVVEKKLYEKGK